MLRTIPAVIDEQGNVRLLEPVQLATARRALVTILDDAPLSTGDETVLLSETALAEDWNRPEEDAAWAHLQSSDHDEDGTGGRNELRPYNGLRHVGA